VPADLMTFVIAVIGAVTGVIGTVTGIIATVLGVYQYRRELDRERVKLRVAARRALSSDAPDTEFLSISVTNMSEFNVTISEAGLLIEDGHSRAIHPYATTSRQRPCRKFWNHAPSLAFGFRRITCWTPSSEPQRVPTFQPSVVRRSRRRTKTFP
jgi:hypothetical protein